MNGIRLFEFYGEVGGRALHFSRNGAPVLGHITITVKGYITDCYTFACGSDAEVQRQVYSQLRSIMLSKLEQRGVNVLPEEFIGLINMVCLLVW